MTEIDYILHDSCDILEDTGDFLKRDLKNRVTLKIMQHNLKEKSKKSNNPDVYFLDFFMTAYIRELFKNLFIDFPYRSEKFGELRTDLLNKFGDQMADTFNNLSNSLIENNYESIYKCYVKLVKLYYEVLKKLEIKYWEVGEYDK